MLKGFYTAASGMIAQQRKQESLSNNLANANTPGYRADETPLRAFPELLMQRIESKNSSFHKGIKNSAKTPVGNLNSGVYVHETIPNFQQGALHETELITDLALHDIDLPDENGSTFFIVQNELGEERFTRNGKFTIDGEGYLTMPNGYYVLDDNGEHIFVDEENFEVTDNGLIRLSDGTEVNLAIAYVEDVHTLRKEGNDLFEGQAIALPNDAMYTVYQGYIEQSNVDPGKTMTEMMNAYRNFEANQRILKAYDESMEMAVSQIGRLI